MKETQAHVWFSQRFTINLGNYESTSIDVGVGVPVQGDDFDSAMDFAEDFVTQKLEKAVQDVQSDRDATPRRRKK